MLFRPTSSHPSRALALKMNTQKLKYSLYTDRPQKAMFRHAFWGVSASGPGCCESSRVGRIEWRAWCACWRGRFQSRWRIEVATGVQNRGHFRWAVPQTPRWNLYQPLYKLFCCVCKLLIVKALAPRHGFEPQSRDFPRGGQRMAGRTGKVAQQCQGDAQREG